MEPGRMIIPRRYSGPSNSGNGGYTAGLVAQELSAHSSGGAEVTLRSPPPLDKEMRVVRDANGVRIFDGEQLVAEGRALDFTLDLPEPVSFSDAEQASRGFPWWHDHPYPICFVCGPERPLDDGLGIHPGPVTDRNVAAAPFLPDTSLSHDGSTVAPENVWAALDCPSWFGMYCFREWHGGALLGRMAAKILTLPKVGDALVAVGWQLGIDGRKVHTASALFSESGAPHAYARATWISVKS